MMSKSHKTALPNGIHAAASPIPMDDTVAPVQPSAKLQANQDMIFGRSKKMQEIADKIKQYAPANDIVLILGGTGTGKGEVAHALHKHNPSAQGDFIAVNCGGLDANLIKDDLFGHEGGAFTGARGKRIGAFEQAKGGTLFLDEITSMPIELQAQLLCAIEDKKIMRVGGQKYIPTADVRIIAAGNTPPGEAMRNGKLREDLFHRLNVLRIVLPSLRNHSEDIPDLINHFAAKKAKESNIPAPKFTNDAIDILSRYDWPGNIRQLDSIVRRTMVEHPGAKTIMAEMLSLPRSHVDQLRTQDHNYSVKDVKRAIRALFLEALELSPDEQFNISKLVHKIEISRPVLSSLLNPNSTIEKSFDMKTGLKVSRYLNEIDKVRARDGKKPLNLAQRFDGLFKKLLDALHSPCRDSIGRTH